MRGKATLIRWTNTHDDDVICPAGISVTFEEFHDLIIDDGGVGVVDGAVATAVWREYLPFCLGGGKGGMEYMSSWGVLVNGSSSSSLFLSLQKASITSGIPFDGSKRATWMM